MERNRMNKQWIRNPYAQPISILRTSKKINELPQFAGWRLPQGQVIHIPIPRGGSSEMKTNVVDLSTSSTDLPSRGKKILHDLM